jgi:UDP-perosamine 4-acetyltransferase
MNNKEYIQIILIGGGGHAKVLSDSIENRSILGYTELNDLNILPDLKYLGNDRVIMDYDPNKIYLLNGIGSVSTTKRRRDIYLYFKNLGYNFYNIIHPFSYVSRSSLMNEGVQVMAGVVVQAGVYLGENSIINSSASIDHDCYIGAHVHIAPGTILSGNVSVGEGTHIGTGSKIIQNVNIGTNCLIGAGSLVLSDIPDNSIAIGHPAKIKK